MTNYKTFKQLVVELSNVKTKEDLNKFCFQIDMSYQHGKISGRNRALNKANSEGIKQS